MWDVMWDLLGDFKSIVPLVPITTLSTPVRISPSPFFEVTWGAIKCHKVTPSLILVKEKLLVKSFSFNRK